METDSLLSGTVGRAYGSSSESGSVGEPVSRRTSDVAAEVSICTVRGKGESCPLDFMRETREGDVCSVCSRKLKRVSASVKKKSATLFDKLSQLNSNTVMRSFLNIRTFQKYPKSSITKLYF